MNFLWWGIGNNACTSQSIKIIETFCFQLEYNLNTTRSIYTKIYLKILWLILEHKKNILTLRPKEKH